MCSGGTIFPEGIAIGSTWDINLVKDIYTVVAREAGAIGVHAIFTLVIEPLRDPRLGRNEEGYTEDPYLLSQITRNIVQAVQGNDISAPDKIVAGLCHYPGQSQPTGGHEKGAMDISERMLREVFLPSWVAGIKEAGALGIMATYPAIDGIPVHSSDFILTKILREELGFKGLALSEGSGIYTLLYERIAKDWKEAGAIALKSGVDVGISFESAYMAPMIENIQEGKVSMASLDRAVRRILRLKYELGLFDNPFVDPDNAVKVSHTKESEELALLTAQEGIVLLKNENNLLPLDKTKIKSIALLGPNADNELNQLGDYTSRVILQDIVTVKDGLHNRLGSEIKINYLKGCDVFKSDFNEIPKAQEVAKKADVAIVIVGENYRWTPNGAGTDGEGKDIANLDLTGMQLDLVKAVVATGTPTVVVLINGRPLSTRWIAENVPAVLEAWNCGEQGGNAIADIIFGDVNPSGRLAVTIPRHVGQLPVFYNYKPSKEYRKRAGYVDMSMSPLYPFGYGLSYTQFTYSNLHITPQESGTEGEFTVQVDIQNTGSRSGKEVVQLYINDLYATVTRPVKELKGFEKIFLKPGEKKTVTFKLNPEHLKMLDRNLNWVVEPGEFKVMIGSSSEDIRLSGNFFCK
jgi:beta-glucosidase